MKLNGRARQSRVGGFALALAISVSAGPSAMASHVGEDLETDRLAVASSDQLVGALRQYEAATAAQRPAVLQRLVQLAAARQERMLVLLERNPKVASTRVLPASLRERLPAQARAFVERPVAVTGTVEATVGDDFARGRSTQRFQLIDAAGSRLELHVADATERDMLSLVGKRSSVAALQFDRRLLVLEKRQLLAAAGSTTTTPAASTASVAAPIQGDQKTLVILANFNDKAIECTAADVQNRLFGSGEATLDKGYRQSSNNLVTFSGTVLGPFTINYGSTGSCDYSGWANALKSAALAAGVDPAAYQRVSFSTPYNSTCGWTGLATIGGASPTPSWVQACTMTGVFSHEIGHNLKFHHAATPTYEYGDESDPLGRALLVQSNAANRVMAGWLAGSQVRDVAGGGSYVLSALESGATVDPQVLRLPKVDTAEYYYVSLRQPIGIDSGLPSTYLNMLSIHRATGTLPARTTLLARLAVGQTWTDSVNGIEVTHQALSGASSTVGVSVGGASCARSAPSVSVTPSSQTGSAGAALAYSLSVTNNNSAACPPSGFSLTQVLPAGFSGTLPAGITLAPGASTNVGWGVTSPSTAADAAYTITANVMESSVGNAVQAHASYMAYTPPPATEPPPSPSPADTTGPAVAITNPSSGTSVSGPSATITATATDDSGVANVAFYVDGKLIATDSSAPYGAKWNLRKIPRGSSHTLKARAVDALGNATEQSVTVTVN